MNIANSQQKSRKDFRETYEQLCALQNSCPLAAVTANLPEEFIDCNADRIRQTDWAPVLNSLKVNNSLRFVALRSFWQQTNCKDEGMFQQRGFILRKRIPAVRSKDVTRNICRSLKEFLTASVCIECLVLQGIPFREGDLATLSKGIAKCKSLKHLSFEHCRFSDGGLIALSTSLKRSTSLRSLDLCGCALTWRGADVIGDIIKYQATKRHGEAWQESLRYRRPDLNGMCGLRRINLCQNTLIGDRGMHILADCLKDDLWIKALDLQQCGVSSQGAEALLSALDYNRSLRVLDVRMNSLLERDAIKAILEKVMLNAGGEDPEYPWITVKEPKESSRLKSSKRPVRFTLSTSIAKAHGIRHRNRVNKQRKSAKRTSQEQTTSGDVLGIKNNKHVPWRTAARLERNKFKSQNPMKDASIPRDKHTRRKRRNSRGKTAENAIVAEIDRLSLEDLENDEEEREMISTNLELKDLEIQLIDYKRRYENEVRQRARTDVRLKELEMENRRLKNEILLLKATDKASPSQFTRKDRFNISALEDENVLENIEASFRQFQKFLDLIKNTNLAELYRLLEED
eukprot:gene7931-8786_t